MPSGSVVGWIRLPRVRTLFPSNLLTALAFAQLVIDNVPHMSSLGAEAKTSRPTPHPRQRKSRASGYVAFRLCETDESNSEASVEWPIRLGHHIKNVRRSMRILETEWFPSLPRDLRQHPKATAYLVALFLATTRVRLSGCWNSWCRDRGIEVIVPLPSPDDDDDDASGMMSEAMSPDPPARMLAGFIAAYSSLNLSQRTRNG